MESACAARVKLPSSATATKYSRWRRSMPPSLWQSSSRAPRGRSETSHWLAARSVPSYRQHHDCRQRTEPAVTEIEGGLDEPTELEPEQGSLALAAEDDRHARSDWEKAAAGGAPQGRAGSRRRRRRRCWEKLARTTLDGIAVAPLGTRDQLDGLDRPAGRADTRGGTGAAGTSAPTSRRPTRRSPPRRSLTDLENGATSVWLELGRPGRPTFARSSRRCTSTWRPSSSTPVRAGRRGRGASSRAPASGRPRPPAPTSAPTRSATGSRRVPSGSRHGRRPPSPARRPRGRHASALVVDAHRGPRPRCLRRPGARLRLAVGAAYLRSLTDAGAAASTRPLRAARVPLRRHRRAVPDDREAARRAAPLGAGSPSSRGAAPRRRGQRQHAVTSRPMMTKYDPWVNMLRTTVAAFAAGVGGADAVTVLPFDAALGAARRLRPPDRPQHLRRC